MLISAIFVALSPVISVSRFHPALIDSLRPNLLSSMFTYTFASLHRVVLSIPGSIRA